MVDGTRDTVKRSSSEIGRCRDEEKRRRFWQEEEEVDTDTNTEDGRPTCKAWQLFSGQERPV